jgi:hypothetical protein
MSAQIFDWANQGEGKGNDCEPVQEFEEAEGEKKKKKKIDEF